MIISQLKRNPFKRSSLIGTPKSSTPNPLSHLTNKAVGYSDTQESMFESSQSIVEDSQIMESIENIENKASNKNTPQTPPSSSSNIITEINERPIPVFMQWYAENKPSLLIDYPDIPANELTKIAMRKYKSFVADMKAEHGNSIMHSSGNKRKMIDDEDIPSHSASGISKLAKFGFSKAA